MLIEQLESRRLCSVTHPATFGDGIATIAAVAPGNDATTKSEAGQGFLFIVKPADGGRPLAIFHFSVNGTSTLITSGTV